MHKLLEDLTLLLASTPSDTEGLYDRVADRYEHFRALWVALAGDAAERPMVAELEAILAPGLRVLGRGLRHRNAQLPHPHDAACGTPDATRSLGGNARSYAGHPRVAGCGRACLICRSRTNPSISWSAVG